MGSTCCIFNLAPHYNAAIYKMMDQTLNCDFFIGNRLSSPIKQMKVNELKGYKGLLKYIQLPGKLYWQHRAVRLSFRSYNQYILTGEPHCLSTWFVLIFAKILGKKTYLWTHGWYGDENAAKKIIKKLFFGFSYKVLLYGDYARNLMIKAGFKSKKLEVIYNSLDFDTQCKISATLKITDIYEKHFQNTYPVVLFIGRLQKEKKLELIIESQKYLANQGVSLNAVIIGTGELEQILKDMAVKYSLIDRIWFYGACYDEQQIAPLIYNAAVTISPGDIGLTAIHSMVYGTPVITHSNFHKHGPEFEAITSGITGDFFEEGSLNSLCDKIVSWISLPINKRESVRQRCNSLIREKYNPHVQIELLKKLLL